MGYDVKAFVLPVEYHRAFEALKSHIQEHTPEVVLSFGVAQNRKKICLERVAINHRSVKSKDNSGFTPETKKILEDGPDGIFSNIKDIDGLSKTLKEKGWKVRVSQSAGDYVCNALMYETCLLATENDFLYDFIHIPAEDLYHELHLKDVKPLYYFIIDVLEALA